MVMSESEIVRFYSSRKSPEQAIGILADMNCTHRFDIKKILVENGKLIKLTNDEKDKLKKLGIEIGPDGLIKVKDKDEVDEEIEKLRQEILNTNNVIDSCKSKMEEIVSNCQDLVNEYFEIKDFVAKLEERITEKHERIEFCSERKALRKR